MLWYITARHGYAGTIYFSEDGLDPTPHKYAIFEDKWYAVFGARKDSGSSNDRATSDRNSHTTHGATRRTPRRSVSDARALKGVSKVSVVIWPGAGGH